LIHIVHFPVFTRAVDVHSTTTFTRLSNQYLTQSLGSAHLHDSNILSRTVRRKSFTAKTEPRRRTGKNGMVLSGCIVRCTTIFSFTQVDHCRISSLHRPPSAVRRRSLARTYTGEPPRHPISPSMLCRRVMIAYLVSPCRCLIPLTL
jgi:hypothetical protein